ncbi:MAG: ABC transporter permease [Phycisphaeraceae bacterium]|nr:ABC transporter permease [Phycisphaeraceae bacterium]
MTFLLETIRLGLKNLRLQIFRSILTALGIILGVAAVITMVSIGEGTKREALREIERLGARNIIVRSQKPPESAQQQGGQQQNSFIARYGLTRDDLAVIEQSFPDAEAIVPVKAVGERVLHRDRRQLSQSFGTTPKLAELANLRIARGRYLMPSDLDSSATVAVIGAEVAKELFPFEDPLFNTVMIDDKGFTVVGILEPVGLAGGAGAALIGRDFNLDVHIPLTTARQVFSDLTIRRTSGSFGGEEVQITEIYISVVSRDRVMVDADRVRRIMEVRHPNLTDVGIKVPFELLQSARRSALTWNMVLAAIAGISLLVGGIGIMNIMLASVTERTREIGIRRAIGATRRHIVWQFLVETSVLAAIGGLAGVALGIGLSLGIEPLMKALPHLPFIGHLFGMDSSLHTHITLWSILVSFFVAALTGLVFGLYPAMKAAAQDPIVALRHD